jgi:hypothetical protein
MPPTAGDTAKVDPPLRPNHFLPIGYGAGGAVPYHYNLKTNQTIDVGYMRLFISTCAVDLSSIPQPSPFTDTLRHVRQVPLPIRPLWDVITVAIIQRPKGAIKAAEEQVKRVL